MVLLSALGKPDESARRAGWFTGKFAVGFRASAFRDLVVFRRVPIRPFRLASIHDGAGRTPL
jgi:hypothetical protein